MATPDTLTDEFERHLATGEIRWLSCDSCGALRATLRTVCPVCLSRKASWRRAATSGRVISYLVARSAIATALDTPYVVVHVELDDGVRLTANLLEADPGELRVGMRVALTVDARYGRPLPQFVLADDLESVPTADPPANEQFRPRPVR